MDDRNVVALHRATFAAKVSDRRVNFQVPTGRAAFRVDVGKRTVSGLAVPFGEVTSDWRQLSFRAGSIDVPTPLSRVKAVMNHYGPLLGVVTKIDESDDGMYASLRLSETASADEALILADDGALDGLSIGVDIHKYEIDEDTDEVTVTSASLREISLTPFPAFDSARVDKVQLQQSNQKGSTPMPDAPAAPAPPAPPQPDFAAIMDAALERRFGKATPDPEPAPVQAALSAEDVRGLMKEVLSEAAPAARVEVDPHHSNGRAAVVREPLPYTFDRLGNLAAGEHLFTQDLLSMSRAKDGDGSSTDAGRRVMALIKATFDVDAADVNELNPTINQPAKYVDQQDYVTPLWDMVSEGGLPNGVQPFSFPKFSSPRRVWWGITRRAPSPPRGRS